MRTNPATVARLGCALAGALALSCGTPLTVDDVVIEQVVPDNGPVGEAVSLELRGTFHVRLVTELGGQQPPLGEWSVTIGGVPATNLVVASEDLVTVTTSPLLPAGPHDVVVTLPDGRAGSLLGGYTAGPKLIDPAPVLIADDPFGDGTPFTYVAAFAGQVYLGPSQDGSLVVRTMPDGSGAQTVLLEFAADVTGNVSTNASPAPYGSIGHSGCTPNTASCGPDNEDGRGLLASGALGGAEWLILGGGRTAGDLDYVYMTPSETAPLAFRYVDLSAAMGPQTRGFSALHSFGDRLYLGFPDTGGARPYLLALVTPPPAPGLDTVEGVEVLQLDASDIPGFATAGTASIDAITDFAARVYIANAGAWARSTIEQPLISPQDWQVITPTAAAYGAKTSVASAKIVDLEPIDRAVPQMVAFRDRLYVARNTTDGPQLWRCDPALSGDAAHCDADDWALIVANSVGDALLSQFDNPANSAISMLTATPTHLYVGFDNTAGVQVFRSGAAAPLTAADFEGEAGCSAAGHPVTCDGLGGPGLGMASNSRLFSGATLTFAGSSTVYLATGSGAAGVRIYRMP